MPASAVWFVLLGQLPGLLVDSLAPLITELLRSRQGVVGKAEEADSGASVLFAGLPGADWHCVS